jgi:hypothetical protein
MASVSHMRSSTQSADTDKEPDIDHLRLLLRGRGINIAAMFTIRIQAGKNDPLKKKKVNKFHNLKCWLFSLEGWWLLVSPGRPSWRLL